MLYYLSEKPPIIFTVKLTMTDRKYSSQYADLTDTTTRGLMRDLTDIFEPFLKRVFPGFMNIAFLEIFPGSVGAIFDTSFTSLSDVNETRIAEAFKQANGTSQLRFEFFGIIEVGPKQNSSSTTVSFPTGLYSLVGSS